MTKKTLILAIAAAFAFATGCYTATPPLINVLSLSDYWGTHIGQVGTGAEVMIMPKGTYASKAPQSLSVNFGVYQTFFPKSADCSVLVSNPRYNYITIRFIELPNGKFDMKIVYITKNGKIYHLQPIKSPSNFSGISAEVTSVRTNSYFWYKVPVFCGSLEDAVFEMSGIYSNGKELPPIKFRINLLNQAGIKS